MTRAMIIAAAAIAITAAVTAPARADDTIGVGLYAPSAPFGGTADRVGFMSAFADHLKAQLGTPVNGRVYGTLGALDAALKSGEIQLAIIDGPALALRGGKPLLTLTRKGESSAAWAVVGGGAVHLDGLAGKKIAVAQTGGRDAVFVANILFEGEVDADHFGAIVGAPDAGSAVKLVPLGKADVAVVPAELAGDLAVAMSLRSIPWPSLVAGGKTDAALVDRVVAAARGWKGAGPFDGFAAGVAAPGGGRTKKRPVMASPPPRRLEVAPVLGKRSFAAPVSDIRRYVSAT